MKQGESKIDMQKEVIILVLIILVSIGEAGEPQCVHEVDRF